jgi:hypothetical protein
MKAVPKLVSCLIILLAYIFQLWFIRLRGIAGESQISRLRLEWFENSASVILTLGAALTAYELMNERIGKAGVLFIALNLIAFWWEPLADQIFDYYLFK